MRACLCFALGGDGGGDGNLRMHLKVHSANANAANVTLHLSRQAKIPATLRRESLSTHFDCDFCGKYMISENVLGVHIEILQRYIAREAVSTCYNCDGCDKLHDSDNVLG